LTLAQAGDFALKGILLGACNCDWGCPCNFESRPTQGFCEGTYVWHVESGRYQGTNLDGTTFTLSTHFPGAPHEGNATAIILIDERADERQRAAIEAMVRDRPPFSIFHNLTSNFLGFRSMPFKLELNGIHSRLSIPSTLDLQLNPMKNPVTGEDELATLDKPTGFTSKRQELCSAQIDRLTLEALSYENLDKYGEFSLFEYPIS